MQENDLSAINGLSSSTPVSENRRDQTLGRDEFLKLLITQLQNQDPLSPEDPSKFVSELTQFSNLEQLIGIREGVAAIGAADASAQNVLDAAPLIGREVLAAGARIEVDEQSRGRLAYDLPRAVDCATLLLKDTSGRLVAQHTLTGEELSAGRHHLEVEFEVGSTAGGNPRVAPGVYRYEIDAAVVDQPIAPLTYISGTATGARAATLGGEVSLLLGDIEVPLSQALEVRQPR